MREARERSQDQDQGVRKMKCSDECMARCRANPSTVKLMVDNKTNIFHRQIAFLFSYPYLFSLNFLDKSYLPKQHQTHSNIPPIHLRDHQLNLPPKTTHIDNQTFSYQYLLSSSPSHPNRTTHNGPLRDPKIRRQEQRGHAFEHRV